MLLNDYANIINRYMYTVGVSLVYHYIQVHVLCMYALVSLCSSHGIITVLVSRKHFYHEKLLIQSLMQS